MIQFSPDTARRFVACFSLSAALALLPLAGHAQGQSGNGWFVPQPPKPAGPPPGAASPAAGPSTAAAPGTAAPPEDIMPMMEPTMASRSAGAKAAADRLMAGVG